MYKLIGIKYKFYVFIFKKLTAVSSAKEHLS